MVLFCVSKHYQMQNFQHARMNGSEIISKSLLSQEVLNFSGILKLRPLQFSMLKNLPKKPLYHPAKFGQNMCYGVEMFEEQTDTQHILLSRHRYSNGRIMPVEDSIESLHLSYKLYCSCLQSKYSLICMPTQS